MTLTKHSDPGGTENIATIPNNKKPQNFCSNKLKQSPDALKRFAVEGDAAAAAAATQ